jgi:hypothetical protein
LLLSNVYLIYIFIVPIRIPRPYRSNIEIREPSLDDINRAAKRSYDEINRFLKRELELINEGFIEFLSFKNFFFLKKLIDCFDYKLGYFQNKKISHSLRHGFYSLSTDQNINKLTMGGLIDLKTTIKIRER